MNNNILMIDSINISLDLDEIKKQLNIAEEDTAFLAGSLIESLVTESSKNMGNRLSDIDVFIITKDIRHYETNSSDYSNQIHKILFREIQGTNFDIEIFDETTIFNLINQMNKYDSNNINGKIYNSICLPNKLELNQFTSFIHRFINSIPLYNKVNYNNIKKMIILEKYYKFMTRLSMNTVENMFDDIVGNLEANEYIVALTLARNMLIETIGAYIFYNRESIDRKKWIVLKFKNISETNSNIKKLYNKYIELNFSTAIIDSKDYKKNVEGIIKFSNKLISEISKNDSL